MKANKDKRSLCEESMLVFANILKLSSISLARRSIIPTSSDHNHDDHDDDNSDEGKSSPPSVHVPKAHRSNMRSLKPEQPRESKLSYVILLEEDVSTTASFSTVDGKFSDYIRRFHEKTKKEQRRAIVEGEAEDYIKRFHEKNMNDLNNESMRRSNFVLPPPPPQVFK